MKRSKIILIIIEGIMVVSLSIFSWVALDSDNSAIRFLGMVSGVIAGIITIIAIFASTRDQKEREQEEKNKKIIAEHGRKDKKEENFTLDESKKDE